MSISINTVFFQGKIKWLKYFKIFTYFSYAKYFTLKIFAFILAKLNGKFIKKDCTDHIMTQHTHLIKFVKQLIQVRLLAFKTQAKLPKDYCNCLKPD